MKHLQSLLTSIAFIFLCISCSSDADLLFRPADEDAKEETQEETNTDSTSDEIGSDLDPDETPEVINGTTTESLGWVAGEDVTDKLETLIPTLKAGDELCLSAMYKLSSKGLQLPDDFTLCAVNGGGFSLVDVQNAKDPFLRIGNRSLWNNITIKDNDVLAAEEVVRTNNKIAVVISERSGVSIINCSFSSNTKTHIRITSSQDLIFKGTHFDYGYYQMLIGANSKNILFEDCLFSNSYGDGIKTLRGGVNGVENVTVKNTVYEDNWRDGIDTTGGFRNSLVENCIFRRNKVSGMDLKNPYEFPEDVGVGTRGNDNIVVRNSEFIDMNNGMVFTTLDRTEQKLITDENHAYHLPNNITIEGSIFENNSGNGGHAFLIKDAHTIQWDGLQLLGGVNLERTMGPRDYPNENHHESRPIISQTNYNIDGVNVNEGAARGANSNYPFATVGPR